MMKTKLLLVLLLAIALVAGTAQANLLLNPSFEDGAFGAYTPDYWTHSFTTYDPMHTWISSAAGAHSGNRYMKMNMWSWSSTAWLFPIDPTNVTGGQEYAFSVWAKCPVLAETSEAWGYYEYLDSAGDVISDDWLPLGEDVKDVGSNWTHVEFGTVTAPESATWVWYSITTGPENGVMGILYDDACIDTPHPSLPTPAWEGLVAIGDVDLSWTNMDPDDPNDSVYVDVWFGPGTKPDPLDPNSVWVYDMTKIVDANTPAGENANSLTAEDLIEGTYCWQVNSYIYGDPNEVNYTNTDPNSGTLYPIIKGYMWSFDVISDAPPSSVDAGVDMITWSEEPVDLDPTVVDDGESPLIYAWSAAATTGGVTSLVLNPNATVEAPTVTITKGDYSEAMIVNASFEDLLIGWDKVATAGWYGVWDGTFGSKDYIIPSDGDWCAWLCGNQGDGVVGAWFSQTLTETLTVGRKYTLEVDVVNDGYYMEDVEYKVQLLAGGVVIAEDDDSWPLPLGETGAGQSPSYWQTSNVVFALGGPSDPNLVYVGQPLGIRLVAKDGTGDMSFDNVHLTAEPNFPAPELSTVELTVKVHDEANPTYVRKNTMTVDVYSDACAAAIAVEAYPADLDENCVIDPNDLYLMAENWLDSTELTAPESLEQGDLIGNAGFEDPPQYSGQYDDTCFNHPSDYHWTKVGNYAGVWNPGPAWPGYGNETPEGENCAYLEGGSGITQVLTETLKAETNYTLSVQVGNNDYYRGGTYTIKLLAGETPLVSHSEDIEEIKDDTFELRTLVYEHNSEDAELIGKPLVITISLLSSSNTVEVDFDDVRLEIERANPDLPSVNAGLDMIAWSGGPVALDPDVVNNDITDPQRTLSYLWSADDDSMADTNLTIEITNADQEDATVEITKTDPTGDATAVTMTLAVTLDEEGTMEDSMVINVYDGACKAATGAGYKYAVTDFNANCITGLGDFAILAKTWLVDYDTLTGPVPKPIAE